MDAKQIIDWFKLQPNQTKAVSMPPLILSSLLLDSKELPGFKPIKEKRPICGAIYYFLDPQTFSAMHRVTGDMLYHFYSGAPVQMLLLYPEHYPIPLRALHLQQRPRFRREPDEGDTRQYLARVPVDTGRRLCPDGCDDVPRV